MRPGRAEGQAQRMGGGIELRASLAELLRGLPPFARRANSTFVELRATLDDLAPVAKAARPVAKRLRPYLAQLRPFLRGAKPTLTLLNRTIASPGSANDLIELLRSVPPVTRAAADRRERNGAQRDGAFPEAARALEAATPLEAHGLAYTTDLVGWLDDYATTGVYDALGALARSQTYVNAFAVTSGTPAFVPLSDRAANLLAGTKSGQYRRCPGAAEAPARDGSNVLSAQERKEIDCREEDRAVR
jgi:phospholipid/cholesterol/gamma-HCH transport system substrate-binding protein